MNILSFDLEDWYQLVHRQMTGNLQSPRRSIFRQTDVLLELLSIRRVRATFFVVGMLGRHFPELIRSISAQGHEIASHGDAHRRVHELSLREFKQDVCRSKETLEDIVGKPVLGFRAPEFSINSGNLWALNVLAESGYLYDSSIFPIHHRRYGIPGFAVCPRCYELSSGSRIIELPLAAVSFAGLRIPVAGGGYFRALPLWALRRALCRFENLNVPMTTYFHPYEFDPVRLDLFRVVPANGWKQRISGWRVNWRNNLGRAGVRKKISALLENHHFTTCQEYLYAVRFVENRELLPATSPAV
ncbi:MAG: polysaccharide deacetylase family protein [Candidatus Acidiferrales bacterium]